MTVKPMTDAELGRVRRLLERRVPLVLSEADRLVARVNADAATISTLTAERDAAVARALPGWRYLATWADVNAVEAQHNSEPAPGLYIVWKPGWPYPSAASVQFGVFATDEESPAPDDYLLGAWIIGPLRIPDLPAPTAAQEG